MDEHVVLSLIFQAGLCRLEIKQKSITWVAFEMCVALTHNYFFYILSFIAIEEHLYLTI